MCSLPLLCVYVLYTYLAASIKILTSLVENTTRVTRQCFNVRIYYCTVCIMAKSIYLTCFNFNTFKSVIFKRKLVYFYAILTFPRYCPYQLRYKCSKETTFNIWKVLPGSTMLICSQLLGGTLLGSQIQNHLDFFVTSTCILGMFICNCIARFKKLVQDPYFKVNFLHQICQ